jgi:lysyl-tRNA synthetase class I
MAQPRGCITDKQLVEIAQLQNKSLVKPLTEKQVETLAQLVLKREQSETEPLSEACMSSLLELYSIMRYGRRFRDKGQFVKQIKKGTSVEEDSLDLIAKLDNQLYKKNEERLQNEWLTGIPDTFLGDTIYTAQWIEDVKSSWDLETFLPNIGKELNSDYEWQLQGYFDLTGAPEGGISFCLVNTPESLINDEKYRLLKQLDVATEEDPLYKELAAEIDLRCTFDDIPENERRIRFTVKRDDARIEKIHKKVGRARKWLQDYHNDHMKIISGQS